LGTATVVVGALDGVSVAGSRLRERQEKRKSDYNQLRPLWEWHQTEAARRWAQGKGCA
jgi:hypothetical protein